MDNQDTPIGLVRGLSIGAYHSGPGISKTGLDDFARSPAIFHALHLNPKRPAPVARAGQLEGNLAHCAILEPAEFAKRYVVIPEDAPRTPSVAQWRAKDPSQESIDAMNWWRRFNDEHMGATIVTAEQHATALAQAASVRALPEVAALLSAGEAEVSAYWNDPVTGVLCRCRPDWVHPVNDKQAILVDIKTCGDAGPREFVRQVARKRYHVQDAHYSTGYEIASGKQVVAFVFVAVESHWPFAAASYRLGLVSRNEGFSECRYLLDQYAECLAANKWPGFSDKTETIELPPYALASEEVEVTYA